MQVDANLALLPISTVSKMTGIGIRMLREYETEGLLKPRRTAGRRLFSYNEIGFIEDIKYYLQRKKLSIAGLKELYLKAPCWESKRCPPDSKCPAYHNLNKECWNLILRYANTKCNSAMCPHCPVLLIKSRYPQRKRKNKEPLSPRDYPYK